MKAITADITRLEVDAIVNAANESLRAGGGVCGAIHRAAGPELEQECLTLGGCQTGQAKLTNGYNLPAKHVIHTVGPVWQGGQNAEAALLASCYRACLMIALERGFRSIAFPAISTGIFGYPLEAATEIAIATTRQFRSEHHAELEVVFCCFDEATRQVYEQELEKGSS